MTNLNRLKVVLVECGKTGKWLAGQLGKSNCTVSKWCSNTVQPDLKTLNEIAAVLKVDVKDKTIVVKGKSKDGRETTKEYIYNSPAIAREVARRVEYLKNV